LKAIILDTETTGLPPEGEACEIAYLAVTWVRSVNCSALIYSKLEPKFHQTFMPKADFHPKASECNGFTKEKLKGSPCISTFKFPEDVCYMIGHNINFDWQILGKPKVKLICTKELAIKYLTKESGKGTKGVNTLTGLIERYYPDEAKELITNAHSALQDCKLCYLILLKVLETAPELNSFEKLAAQCKQPAATSELPKGLVRDKEGFVLLAFGKFHGFSMLHMVKFEKSYLTWIVEKSTMSQGLKDWVKQFMIDNK
jgi:exodeoxyribonuclease X